MASTASKRWLVLAPALVALGLLLGPATATAEPRTIPIGTGHVTFTNSELFDAFTIRAFVPTGSTSKNCLLTLGETNWGPVFDWEHGNPTGQNYDITMFCGARVVDGVAGVLVSLMFNGHWDPVPEQLGVDVTIYQEGAKGYGTPKPYTDS